MSAEESLKTSWVHVSKKWYEEVLAGKTAV